MRDIWASRRAAWAIEDLGQDVGLVCQHMGRKRLESVDNAGSRLAEMIALERT